MIERNLGNAERLIRLVMGIVLAIWTLSRETMNGAEWVLAICAFFLLLNGIFSRCYLWYILELKTFKNDEPECRAQTRKQI